MSNTERDERDIDLTDEQSDLYDDGSEDSLFDSDTFGERIDSTGTADDDNLIGYDSDDDMLADETVVPTDTAMDTTTSSNQVEEGFGEAINPTANPHLSDQLDDPQLSREAESDFHDDGSKDNGSDGDGNGDSLMDKAKQKLNEWTSGD